MAFNLAPTGSVLPFAGATIPNGWLLCDGSAVSRALYSTLFSIIGTAWGYGDQSTTFNLPNLRAQFLRGKDAGSGNDPNVVQRVASSAGGATGDNVGSYEAHGLAANGLSLPADSMSLTGTTTFTASDHTHTYSGVGSKSYVTGTGFYYGNGGTVLASGQTYSTGVPSASGTVGINYSSGVYTDDNEIRPENAYVNYIIKV